jgi:ankyrin repeat protein
MNITYSGVVMPERQDTSSKQSHDPTDIYSASYNAQFFIIANDPNLTDPFRDIFANNPLHQKFLDSGKPSIRIGVYKTEENELRYYEYDKSQTNGRKDFDSLTALLKESEFSGRIKNAQSSRIYFHGHGNGGGDGIGGDHKNEQGKPYGSEKINNDNLIAISKDILNNLDNTSGQNQKAHFAFLACNYANIDEASTRGDKKTNATRFYEKAEEFRKDGITTTVAAATTTMAVTSLGKVFEVNEGEKKHWKSSSARKILFHDDERAIEIEKPTFASTETAIERKKNVLNYLNSDYTNAILENYNIDKKTLINNVCDNHKINNLQDLTNYLKDSDNTSYKGLHKKLDTMTAKDSQKTFYDKEQSYNNLDEQRFCTKLEKIATKSAENINQNDAAYVALANGNADVKDILAKYDVKLDDLNIKFKENKALDKAYKVIQQFDIPGCDINSTQLNLTRAMGETPLTFAMRFSDANGARSKEIDRVFQEFNMEELKNTPNANGDTPIMLAVQKKDHEILNKLLALSPDLNARDADGQTALMQAENEEFFKTLLSHTDFKGLSMQDNQGNTVINQLIQYDNELEEKLNRLDLLSKSPGWDPKILDIGNEEGVTPLMFAAQDADRDLVTQLLKCGADPRITKLNAHGREVTAINFIPEGASNGEEIKTALKIRSEELNSSVNSKSVDLKQGGDSQSGLPVRAESESPSPRSPLSPHKPEAEEDGQARLRQIRGLSERFQDVPQLPQSAQAIAMTQSESLPPLPPLQTRSSSKPETGKADDQILPHTTHKSETGEDGQAKLRQRRGLPERPQLPQSAQATAMTQSESRTPQSQSSSSLPLVNAPPKGIMLKKVRAIGEKLDQAAAGKGTDDLPPITSHSSKPK